MPGIASAFANRKPTAAGPTVRLRERLMPMFVVVGVMGLTMLLFLLFGIGVGSVFQQVAASPLLIGLTLFLLAIVGTMVALAGAAARRAPTGLYTVFPDPRKRRKKLLLAGSLSLALLVGTPGLLAAFDLLEAKGDAWLHLLSAGILLAVGPYGFYVSREANRVRRLEERFPDFLRDLATSHRAGLTLPAAVVVTARGEYGPLTPEIRKMSEQIQWHVSFGDALQQLAERVQTPLVQRATILILEADRTGGSTTDLLLAAARDAREIKTLENERRMAMGLYAAVVHISFLVFLGVAAVLYGQFVPQVVESSNALAAGAEGGGAGAEMSALSGGTVTMRPFQELYYAAALVQAVGSGFVAGLMGAGRATLGLRHAFIMTFISYLTFGFLL